MAKSVNPRIPVPYVLLADRPAPKEGDETQEAKEGGQAPAVPPGTTKFLCTVLTAEEHAHLEDLSQSSPGAAILVALDFGLADVVDLPLEEGQPLRLARDTSKRKLFDKYPWKRSLIDRISSRDRQEVAGFILGGCKLSEAEAKNF